MSVVTTIFISCITFILCILYYVSTKKFGYWKKKKVPYVKPLPVFGNFKDYILHKAYHGVIAQNLCKKFHEAQYVGAYFGTEPTLIVKDPEIVKLVLAKDFYYFNSRDIANYTNKEIVTQNLFFTYGDRWKVIRQNLTPLFTAAKMKNMFPLVVNCTKSLDTWLTEEVSDAPATINVRKVMANYTMDCIGSCVLGVNTNTLSRGSEVNVFQIMGDKIFEPTLAQGLKVVWKSMFPAIFYGLGFKYVEESVTNFFNKLLTDVFASRNYEPTQRNDFVDLILGLKKHKYVIGDSITNMKTGENNKTQLEVNEEFLVSNCVVLFAAGYETSATTLSYALYELAKHQDIQSKAIEEVDSYWLRKKAVEYDCITDLPYLYACLEETLRLYPVLGVITREVMEDYTLPTGLQLDKGVRIHIPVYYLHHNPDFFPEPEQYRPERFLDGTTITPYTYLPFGEGPRLCIGVRFAKMQMLAGLLTVLRKYCVELAEGMPTSLPFEPKSLTSQPQGKILLKFTKRNVNKR